jgi:glycosyltransferase involved in cell wall biosynthesis
LRQRLKLPLDRKIVAYVGKRQTMGEDKGVAELEEVLNSLAQENPEIYPLIVSESSPKDVPAYMKAVDVLVMNYPNTDHYARYMSPLKLFEYMASGNPIVTTDLPSIREVLNEENSILVKWGSEKGMERGIEKLLLNDAVRTDLTERAHGDVSGYAWHHRARRIMEFVK